MNKRKIFNDPVYGFITVPFDIIFDLISHPYFQRLRRIKQLGLSDYVYPGAFHSRFHHALGAMHLMQQAIQVLRSKDISITDEEYEAICVAILLHDIGHSPFSHALEGSIISLSHEEISLKFFEILNDEFEGRLSLAISIFTNRYHKKFLHQLVSSQLDMDRMDYLTRDSFFTGVAEGVIGYDRIIKMLTVADDQLVVEEKGIHSIERFILSRYFMYSQVYLHRTVIAAEQMLKKFIELCKVNCDIFENSVLCEIWHSKNLPEKQLIHLFADIDDIDIIHFLKIAKKSQNSLLSFIAEGLLDRKLFKTIFFNDPVKNDLLKELRFKTRRNYPEIEDAGRLVINGTESNASYIKDKDEIKILMKSNHIKRFSEVSKYISREENSEIHYICFPPKQ